METTLTPEQELLEFFKALAEPKRLKLIGILAQKPCSVEELAAMVGLRESTVSHHLSYLSHAGLVSARAEGTTASTNWKRTSCTGWLNGSWPRKLCRLWPKMSTWTPMTKK